MKPITILELTVQLATPAWKGAAALAGAALSFVLPQPLQREMAIAAFALIGLDTATGLIAAWQAGQAVTSARFSRVLAKLVGYSSVVVVSAIAGKFIANGSPIGDASQVAVLTLILTTEGISILENVRKMGLQFPAPLERLLKGAGDEKPANEDPRITN